MQNLKQLFEAMKNGNDLGDWDKLPVFSDNEPNSTLEVWSYDDEQMIVGTCSSDIKIVNR